MTLKKRRATVAAVALSGSEAQVRAPQERNRTLRRVTSPVNSTATGSRHRAKEGRECHGSVQPDARAIPGAGRAPRGVPPAAVVGGARAPAAPASAGAD